MPQPDRWLFGPVVATVSVFAVVMLITGIPGIFGFLLMPVSLIGFVLAAIGLTAAAVVFAVKKRFRRATSLLLAVFVPVLLREPINWATDVAHLGLTVWFDMGYFGHGVKPNSRGFAVYDWSVGLVTNPSTFLIRDDTDSIASKSDRARLPADENGWLEGCKGKSRQLLGHYFICQP